MVEYKTITHGVTDVAPFVGAVICAVDCKLKCKGCNTRSFKKLPTKKTLAIDVFFEVASHKENEGIILGGLEWTHQIEDMLVLLELASELDLKIMVQTGLDVLDFFQTIGISRYEKTQNVKIDTTADNFDGAFFQTLGAIVIDYYTPKGYFLKCGKYDRENLAPEDYTAFGVHLASTNQKIYEIKETPDEDKSEVPE